MRRVDWTHLAAGNENPSRHQIQLTKVVWTKHQKSELLSPMNTSKRMCLIVCFWSWLKKQTGTLCFMKGTALIPTTLEIRRLVALYVTMGDLHYPRLRLYLKPDMRGDLKAFAGMSHIASKSCAKNLWHELP